MMVETILECSQEFGMSAGGVPQWKRELLQRRAARPRPPPPAPPPPPPPAPSLEDDEELRYGPGIVKRLQSRYLSLALRDQTRRRAAVLRRAASLEHLLDEPPRPARPPRPASLALTHPSARRDSIKRARSVDALSRLDRRPPSPASTAIVCTVNGTADCSLTGSTTPSAEPIANPAPTAPPLPRSARPPRRPQPLLRDTEKPPPDLVRSALRKFEPACPKRGAPAARVAAVLRGLEPARGPQPRTSTPEPRGREPSPAADLSAIDEPEGAVPRPVSRAALDGIAKAGSTMKFSFPAARPGTHLPPLAATNSVLVARRVGVIRPLPPATPPPPPPKPDDLMEKISLSPRLVTPPPPPPPPPPPSSPPTVEARLDKREPPAALVEPMVRSPLQEIQTNAQFWERRVTETPERAPRDAKPPPPLSPPLEPLTNGHRVPSPPPCDEEPAPGHRVNGKLSKISAAKIERAWNSPSEKKDVRVREKSAEVNGVSAGAVAAWARGSPGVGRKRGAPPPAAPASVSVVFNFSSRKEVPDYIENDGVILRASKRDKIKAGDPGVVVLDPGLACADSDSDSDSERQLALSRPPSPCAVRFVNDNVLINGKSSLLVRDNHARLNKLKLQFDDSLTRTFEYPSETSLCEDDSPHPHPAHLAANTHIASAALSGYTPSKTRAEEFRLGVTRHEPAPATAPALASPNKHDTAESAHGGEEEACEGDVRPCGGGAARSWSEARTHRTDLLF